MVVFSLNHLSLSLSHTLPWSRFEIEIEPIFGSLALYDVKEKKKVLLCDSEQYLSLKLEAGPFYKMGREQSIAR